MTYVGIEPLAGKGEVLRVVSVSLGSSNRDHAVSVELLGRQVSVERIGTDGDFARACSMISELDGHVAAIGLGGIDLYLVAGRRKYVIRQALRLARCAKLTPVVDGSGLKNTLERETIRWLVREGIVAFRGKRVLVVSAVDRFGMAEAFVEAGAQTVFGDLVFALNIPLPIRSLGTVRVLAALLLPLLCRLPISVLYPTGAKQERTTPRHARWFQEADVVAGDFHFIRRNMPERMHGKVVITNTTTPDDVALLRERGAAVLVTTTPEFEGRSFGTNVMEGVLIALAGKRPEEMQPRDYLELLIRLGWRPRVEWLAQAES